MHQQAEAAKRRAVLLADQIAPMIAAELALAEERRRAAEQSTKRMMAACKAVGAATDRLLQAKYTQREGVARLRLEQAAVRLRDEMRRQHGR